MWDLSQNDGPTANVLMHIIIYFTVYEKKKVFVFVLVVQWTLDSLNIRTFLLCLTSSDR